MKTARIKMNGVRGILERKEAELVQALRERSSLAIEKSADELDEIQYASERDLAIRNADRESNLLRQVRAALRRIHGGTFGFCVDCEGVISPKRLAAVPWAPCCIRCQKANDRGWQVERDLADEALVNAALSPSIA